MVCMKKQYMSEWEKNEKNRSIKIIKPQYIRRVVSEFGKVMSS